MLSRSDKGGLNRLSDRFSLGQGSRAERSKTTPFPTPTFIHAAWSKYGEPTSSSIARRFGLHRMTVMSVQTDVTALRRQLHAIPVAEAKGPRWVGSVFGDFVYHNWGSTWPGLYDTADAAWQKVLERYVC